MNSKLFTIIIPAFNEEEAIGKTLQELLQVEIEKECRILVIDDGSSDKTFDIVKTFPIVDVIRHPYNKGYGASLKTGIRASTTEFIILYDADGQHTPESLLNVKRNRREYDMLIGMRGKDSHQDWIRKPGKWILSKVANFLTGRKIPDLNSGLRVINRDIIKNLLHLMPNGFSFSTTSTIAFMNLGYMVGYQPIKVQKRIGKSSVKQLKHGSSTILLILRLIVLFNPLKVFLPISLFLFSLGVLYEVLYGVILAKDHIRLIPTAFFLLITGITIFFFGLVVDQVSELRKHININEMDRL
jgi:glycosyltransferase involved in cell wall biosynthesis